MSINEIYGPKSSTFYTNCISLTFHMQPHHTVFLKRKVFIKSQQNYYAGPKNLHLNQNVIIEATDIVTGYVADTVRVRRALSAGGWEGCIFFRIRKFFICLHTFSHVDPQKIILGGCCCSRFPPKNYFFDHCPYVSFQKTVLFVFLVFKCSQESRIRFHFACTMALNK